MAIESVWCPVVHSTVRRITNLEGEVTSMICSEYEERSGRCRVKAVARQGGPLSQMLEAVSQDTLSHPSTQCDLKPGFRA
jgi:hypothetical protein